MNGGNGGVPVNGGKGNFSVDVTSGIAGGNVVKGGKVTRDEAVEEVATLVDEFTGLST